MSYHNLHTSLHYLVKTFVLKNRKLHCLEKGATRFVRIFQIILHMIS